MSRTATISMPGSGTPSEARSGGLTTATCGQRYSYNSRIYNGEKAKETDWPWMAHIVWQSNGRETRCGGAFISDSWIITAQHCLERRVFGTTVPHYKSDITVSAGMTDVGDPYGGTLDLLVKTYRVVQMIRHPGYDRVTNQYDFALLQVQPVQYSTDYFEPKPICLSGCKAPSAGQMCQVAGYGFTSYTGRPSSNFQQADVPIVNDQACKSTYAPYGMNIDEATMICAGYPNGEKDACTFDSGGPLVCHNGQSENFYLAGVVSFGYKCGETYGVYARVAAVKEWIQSTIATKLPTMSCAASSETACGECGSFVFGSMTFYKTDLAPKHGHSTYKEDSSDLYLIPLKLSSYIGWIIAANAEWNGWSDPFKYVAIKGTAITCPHDYNGQFYKVHNGSYQKAVDTIRCDKSKRPTIPPQIGFPSTPGSECCSSIMISGHGQRDLPDPLYLTGQNSPGTYINYQTGYTMSYNTGYKAWLLARDVMTLACYMSSPIRTATCPSTLTGLFACHVYGWRVQYNFRITCV